MRLRVTFKTAFEIVVDTSSIPDCQSWLDQLTAKQIEKELCGSLEWEKTLTILAHTKNAPDVILKGDRDVTP